MGMFLGCAGALMLVVPNRFTGPGFALLRPHLMPVAITFFVLGTALVVATAFGSNRLLASGLQVLVGAAFLLLAAGFIQIGSLAGGARFVVFGLGTVATPFLSGLLARGYKRCDPFALLIGLATAITGPLLLAGARRVDVGDQRVLVVGVALLAAGVALTTVQLLGSAPIWMQWAARVLVAASFLAFLLVSPLPSQSWLGVMYYIGFGAALLAGPIVAPRLTAGPTSLAAQLGVAVMLASAIPLVTIVTIIANRQQDMMRSQSLQSGQTLAAVLADDVAGFAQVNYEIVTGIAGTPHLMDLTAAEKAQLLRENQRVHPNVFAVSIYDAAGRSLARGDNLPPVNRAGEPVLESARQTNVPSFQTIIGRNSGVPTFIFGAPIRDPSGEFAGIATISVPSDRWLELLKRASGKDSAYIVSNDGHVLAHPDPAVNAAFADFSSRPSVRALLNSPPPSDARPSVRGLSNSTGSGALSYDGDSGVVFAAYARVPQIGGVVVEQSAEAVLAPVYSGRELTLKTLVIIVVLASSLGLLVARSLAAPLGKLAGAAEQLAFGNAGSPLPHSRVSEVRHLATIFGAMRETLWRQNQEALLARQEALAQSQQLQAVLAGIVNGVTAQGPDGQLLYANEAAAHMTDFESVAQMLSTPRHDILGRFQILDQNGQPFPLDQLPGRIALQGRKPPPTLMRYRSIDTGEERWVVVTAQPLLGPGGEVHMAINVMHDVTAEKLAEDQKAEFLSALAHDLKTPLTALKGASQLMIRRLRNAEKPSDRWFREELQRIDATTERMANLVSELLEVRYIGSSQGVELAPTTFDLTELAEQVAGELRSTTTVHRIEVRAPGQPLTGQWDKARLGRVLANLIENAIKYSPGGGDISIELQRAGAQASITVRDHGIGVPEAEQARVFERFQRGSNVPDAVRGTGVGLAYARWVVAQHNGRLQVESTPGRGSAFIIELPLNAGVERAPGAVPA